MKSTITKSFIAVTLLLSSAAAFAANIDCCGDLACCLNKMLACCF